MGNCKSVVGNYTLILGFIRSVMQPSLRNAPTPQTQTRNQIASKTIQECIGSTLLVSFRKFRSVSVPITHKKITEPIPEQFRFGNFSTQITEDNSQNNSVRDSVILCSHFLPRPSNSRNTSVRLSRSGNPNYRKWLENNNVWFGNHVVCNGKCTVRLINSKQ